MKNIHSRAGFSLKKTIISIASTAVLGVGGLQVSNPSTLSKFLPESLKTQVTEIAQNGAEAVGNELSDTIGKINPDKQLGGIRNSQRATDIKTILDAVFQFSVSNGGRLPQTVPTTPGIICSRGDKCGTMVNLGGLVTKKYLSALPIDPKATGDGSSGYEISKDRDGRVTVCAPLTEGDGKKVCATR